MGNVCGIFAHDSPMNERNITNGSVLVGLPQGTKLIHDMSEKKGVENHSKVEYRGQSGS